MKMKIARKAICCLLLIVILCAVLPNMATQADAAEAQSAEFISRSDGIWLWPMPNYTMSDWAGCNGNSSCYFHPGDNHGGCAAWSHATSNGYGHSGFDAAASISTPVYAMAAGTAYVRYQDARGYYVVVEHPIGKDGSGSSWSYYTYYQHLSEFTVADGTPVSAGTTIGKTGNSGTSTGPHLHVGMVLGKSGCYDSIYDLECKGWVTTSGFKEGRILNNPALNSPAGNPTYTDGCGNNVRLHAGSVQYTQNPGDVAIGEKRISYATVTEGNYALKNTATGTYAVVENNADVCGQNILSGTNKEGFAITKSTTTDGYALRPLCSAGGKMNVYTAEIVSSGNTVCLWDDTGHVSQRWNFEKVNGGYVIRSVQNPSCALNMQENGDVYVSTYTGAASQIWALETYCADHKYSSATCTSPAKCTICGITSGKALGHSYTNACDTTCNRSGCSTKRSITHSYAAATCTAAKTCKVCKATSGKALGHSYTNACDTTCNRSGCSTKRSITHSYAAATCTKAKTCKVCGKTSGKALGHSYTNACDTTCNRSGCSTKRSITHSYAAATCTKAKTCKVCGKTSGKKLGHDYKTTLTKATLKKDGKEVKVCTRCDKKKTTTIYKIKTVKLSTTEYTYNGKAKKPTVTVKDSKGNKLKEGTDYTVSYDSGRKKVGEYDVSVKFKGDYSGKKTLTFTIKPKAASINKLTAKTKALTVKLNRSLQQSSGYQIQYSTSSKFTSAKKVTISSYKTSTKTIKDLKKNKKYYVRVRTYKIVDGDKIYSNWSTPKSIKTK